MLPTQEELQKSFNKMEKIYREFKERLKEIEEERDARISPLSRKIEERKKEEILEKIQKL